MQDLFSAYEKQSSKEIAPITFDPTVLRTALNDKKEIVYCLSDVLAMVTETKSPKDEMYHVKKNLTKEGVQLSQIVRQYKFMATNGRRYSMLGGTREQIFRVLQEVNSPRVAPFKSWLAKLGNERLEEIENPALGVERARAEYLRKGYSEEWVKQRIDGILHFKQMTDELKEAGAKEDEYGKLINTQHVHAFGVTVQQHKDMKGLSKTQSLRNASSQWENMVQDTADSVSRELLRQNKPSDFNGRNNCMARGGNFGARVKAMLEEELGRPVLSSENYGAIGAKESPLL